MKYLLLLALTTSCAGLLGSVEKKEEEVFNADKIERCVQNLVGKYDVDATTAADICIKIRRSQRNYEKNTRRELDEEL